MVISVEAVIQNKGMNDLEQPIFNVTVPAAFMNIVNSSHIMSLDEKSEKI